MPNKPRVLIAISEFVEPRDFGEVVISVDDRVLARKSNIPLYDADPGVVLDFVQGRVDRIRELGEVEVVFENVDAGLREQLFQLLN